MNNDSYRVRFATKMLHYDQAAGDARFPENIADAGALAGEEGCVDEL